jgi:CheY-like chemotaxis protein
VSRAGFSAKGLSPDFLACWLSKNDEDSAELLGMVLEFAGYQAFVAESAAEALEMARLIQPHVALLDCGLHVVDGCELAAVFRAQPVMSSCRFVATGGHPGAEAAARSLAAGFDPHLTKPLDCDAVLAAVAFHSAKAGAP